MRMVSKNYLVLFFAVSLASSPVAWAVSPSIPIAQAAASGIEGANAQCQDKQKYYEKDQITPKQEKKTCDECKTKIDDWKKKSKKAMSDAAKEDQAQESKATSSNASTAGNAPKAQNGKDFAAAGVNSASQAAKLGQAANLTKLDAAMNQCKSDIEKACGGDLAEEDKSAGDQAKKACEDAGKAAKKGADDANKEAEKMGENEKKSQEAGKGMEMPKMPEMPKKEEQKPESGISSNTATNTATKVADSALSGNQLGGNKVGIGGTDDKAVEKSTAIPGFHSGGGFESGISANKNFDAGSGAFNGGAHNGSGSSSSGGSGGSFGGSGGGDSGSANTAAAPALPAKTDDIEAFSNGGSRPSYLGVKSKGSELADLGLEGAGTAPADAGSAGAAGDRSLASKDQSAGIHTEENADSLFNMIRERLKEVGRRGSI